VVRRARVIMAISVASRRGGTQGQTDDFLLLFYPAGPTLRHSGAPAIRAGSPFHTNTCNWRASKAQSRCAPRPPAKMALGNRF